MSSKLEVLTEHEKRVEIKGNNYSTNWPLQPICASLCHFVSNVTRVTVFLDVRIICSDRFRNIRPQCKNMPTEVCAAGRQLAMRVECVRVVVEERLAFGG